MRSLALFGCLIWCSFFGLSEESHAQQMDRALVAQYNIQTLRRDGRVVGCSIEFHAMVAPSELVGTKVLYIPGSLVYEVSGSRNLGMLKIGAFEIEPQKLDQSRPARSRPLSVQIGRESLRVVNSYASTPDGYWLLVLEPEEAFLGMAKLVTGQPLTIGWKREGFAYDHAIELAQSAGEKERTHMEECVKAVMLEAEKTLREAQPGR